MYSKSSACAQHMQSGTAMAVTICITENVKEQDNVDGVRQQERLRMDKE
jgi:hypothetical protein